MVTWFAVSCFRGSAANSGIHAIRNVPSGAGFAIEEPEWFISGVLVTDAEFGTDGGLYLSDWVEGWGKPMKGRIYRVHHPEADQQEVVVQTRRLLREGMGKRPNSELQALLVFPDLRVRREAQFELASRGVDALESLESLEAVARKGESRLARIHAIWGMTQAAMGESSLRYTVVPILLSLATDADAEIRNQVARSLGEIPTTAAFGVLVGQISDDSPRVRYSACLSLGKLRLPEAVPFVLQMIRDNGDADIYLRHAGVMALKMIHDVEAIIAAGASFGIAGRGHQCLGRLAIRGERGEAGPPLDDLREKRDRRYILESILFPNASITEGYATWNVETKTGDFYSGIIAEETDDLLVLNSPADGRVEIRKADVESRFQGLSGMPEGMQYLLSPREIRDLVEYLGGRPNFNRRR